MEALLPSPAQAVWKGLMPLLLAGPEDGLAEFMTICEKFRALHTRSTGLEGAYQNVLVEHRSYEQQTEAVRDDD